MVDDQARLDLDVSSVTGGFRRVAAEARRTMGEIQRSTQRSSSEMSRFGLEMDRVSGRIAMQGTVTGPAGPPRDELLPTRDAASQVHGELKNVVSQMRNLTVEAESAARIQLRNLSGFIEPLSGEKIKHSSDQLKGLSGQFDFLRHKLVQTEQGTAAFTKLRMELDRLGASKSLRSFAAEADFEKFVVPIDSTRSTIKSIDELSAADKRLLNETDQTRLGILQFGRDMRKASLSGQISAKTIEQLTAKLAVLKARLESIRFVDQRAYKDLNAHFGHMGRNLGVVQDNMSAAGIEAGQFRAEMDGQNKITAETSKRLRNISSASQGAMFAFSAMQGSVVGAGFSLIFARFAILKVMAIAAAVTIVILTLVKVIGAFIGVLKGAAKAVREFGKEAQQMASYLRSAAESQAIQTMGDSLARQFGVARDEATKMGFELQKLDLHFERLGKDTNFFGAATVKTLTNVAAATETELSEVGKAWRELWTADPKDADELDKLFKEFGKTWDINLEKATDSAEVLRLLEERFSGAAAAGAEQLDGHMVRLGETFKTVRIQIGALLETGLKPIIKGFIAFGEGLSKGFADAKNAGLRTGELNDSIRGFATAIRELTPYLFRFGAFLGGTLYRTMGLIASISKGMAIAFRIILNPAKALQDALHWIGQKAKVMLDKMPKPSDITDALSKLSAKVSEFANGAWTTAWDAVSSVASLIADRIPTWSQFKKKLEAIVTALPAYAESTWRAAWYTLSAITAAIPTSIPGWSKFLAALGLVTASVAGYATGAWTTAWRALGDAFKVAVTDHIPGWDAFLTAFTLVTNEIAGYATGAWATGWSLLKTALSSVVSYVPTWDKFKAALGLIIEELAGYATGTWTTGWKSLKLAISAITGWIPGWAAFETKLASLLASVSTYATGIWTAGWGALKTAMSAIPGFLPGWDDVGSFAEKFGELVESLETYAGAAWETVWGVVRSKVFIDPPGFFLIWQALGSFATALKYYATNDWSKIWTGLATVALGTMNLLPDSIKTVLDSTLEKIKSWAGDLIGPIVELLDFLSASTGDTINSDRARELEALGLELQSLRSAQLKKVTYTSVVDDFEADQQAIADAIASGKLTGTGVKDSVHPFSGRELTPLPEYVEIEVERGFWDKAKDTLKEAVNIIALTTAGAVTTGGGGLVAGAIGGGLFGGALGLLGGPFAPVTVPAGAAAGATVGGVLGLLGGIIVGGLAGGKLAMGITDEPQTEFRVPVIPPAVEKPNVINFYIENSGYMTVDEFERKLYEGASQFFADSFPLRSYETGK